MNFKIAVGALFITVLSVIVLFFMPTKESDIISLPYFKSLIGVTGFIFFTVCSKVMLKVLQRGHENDE